MIKSIKLLIPMILVSGMLFSQTIQGNWDLNAAIVEYTYETREFDSPEDSANGSYAVTASWPSSAAAAAGMDLPVQDLDELARFCLQGILDRRFVIMIGLEDAQATLEDRAVRIGNAVLPIDLATVPQL